MKDHRFAYKQAFKLIQSLLPAAFTKAGHRTLFAFLISLLIGFSFQNCGNGTGIRFQSLSSLGLKSEASSSGGTGNGQGYEGKPDGEYIRRVPGDVCNGKPLSVVNFSKDQISMKTLNLATCVEVAETVAVERVSVSPIQKNVLAVDDGVYEKKERVEKNGPVIAEAWCHVTSGSDRAQDVVIKRDANQGFGNVELKVASQLNTSPLVRTAVGFNASRRLNKRALSYESPSFSLTVDLHSTLSSGRGDYRGQLTFDFEGEHFDESVLCRIGGELDGAIWPSVLVAKERAEQVYWFKDGERVLFSSKNSDGVNELFLKTISDGSTIKLSPAVVGAGRGGVRDFVVSDDETRVLAATDFFSSPYAFELYGFSLSSLGGGSWTRLSGPVSEAKKDVANDYRFIGANKVAFRASSLISVNDGDKYLFTVNMDGSNLVQMHETLGPDEEVENLTYLPGKKVYLYQRGFGMSYDFALSDVATAESNQTGFINSRRLNIVSRLPSSEYLPWYEFKPIVTADEKFLIFRTINMAFSNFHLYIYDFEHDQISPVVATSGSTLAEFSDDRSFVAIPGVPAATGSSLKLARVLGANVGASVSIQDLPVAGELISFHWLAGTAQIAIESVDRARNVLTRVVYSATDRKELSKISWAGAPTDRVSLGGAESVLRLDDGSGEYQFNVDQVSKKAQLKFVSYADGRVVSIPRAELPAAVFRSLSFSPDKTKIVFLADVNSDGEDELYVAYLDGQGIRQVSDRFQLFGGVTQFFVSEQTGKILFLSRKGPANVAGSVQMFVWDGQ